MQAEFNPYTEWLGVPAGVRSPNHYELLGLKLLESEQKRALQEYVERSQRIRRLQVTQPQLVTQVLNELAIACDCLTDPRLKQAYDTALCQQLGIQPPARLPSQPPPLPQHRKAITRQGVRPPPLPSRRASQRLPGKRRWVKYAIIIVLMLLAGLAMMFAASYYIGFSPPH